MKKIMWLIILVFGLTFLIVSCSNNSQKKYSNYNYNRNNKDETYYGLTKQELDSLMKEIDKNLQGK